MTWKFFKDYVEKNKIKDNDSIKLIEVVCYSKAIQNVILVEKDENGDIIIVGEWR